MAPDISTPIHEADKCPIRGAEKGPIRGAEKCSVVLPDALLRLFPGAERDIAVPPGTLAEVLDHLDQRHPGIRDRLCDSRPAIRRHLHLFVDGEKAELGTFVGPGSEVLVVLAISGG